MAWVNKLCEDQNHLECKSGGCDCDCHKEPISESQSLENSLASIAESLKTIALCAEITIRWEQDIQARQMSLEAFLRMQKHIRVDDISGKV